MKVAAIPEFRANAAALLDSEEPLLLTEHGQLSGFYLPLLHPERLPSGISRELAAVVGRHLSQILEAQEVSEEELAEDFNAHRRRSR